MGELDPQKPVTRKLRVVASSALVILFQLSLLGSNGVAGPQSAFASLPSPGGCQNDVDGANDEPGQKDVTRTCVGQGDGLPYDVIVSANWDETKLPGNNTADVCTLFDSDDNGLVNLAVCVTLQSSGSINGKLAVLQAVRLFSCGDSKSDRCTNSVLIAGPYTSQCEVAQKNSDPFGPAVDDGPGDDFPDDTEILCGIDLSDFGAAAATGVTLLETCSYPSTVANSDPSDCVFLQTCSNSSDCDDDNECTTDSCSEGICRRTALPRSSSCSDDDFCDGGEECSDRGFCERLAGRSNDDSDSHDDSDGNDCTIDSCDEREERSVNDPRNSLCGDGLFCNGVEFCDEDLGCQSGPPPNCNDGVSCTIDSCNESTDSCEHVLNPGACDNGLYCDGVEICSAVGGCQAGVAPNCDDGVTCTVDSCNEGTDSCNNAPNDATCDDGLYCNGDETCDAVADCQNGAAPNCNDSVGCTNDSCNETTDTCDNLPNNSACGDGQFCSGVEVCDPIGDCQLGGDPCPGAFCNESTDQCGQCLTDADCNNGVYCDGQEACDLPSATCIAGLPVVCDDGVSCTVDSCNESTDSCDNAVSNAICDNGLYCDGTETCDAVNDCQVGTPPDCADGVGCTVDSCDESTDSCKNAPNNAGCSNGLYCDGVEVCDAVNGCQAGTPPSCGDGVGCTTDSCNEATDSCDNTPNNSTCDNGLFCDGAEICDGLNDCQAGSPPSCGDGVGCTVDSCNEATDSCDHAPDNGTCSNGLFCDGPEICDILNDCQAGSPPSCGDGVGCTVDSCNEATDSCDHAPNNPSCDNGLYCDGTETCDAVGDCQAGAPPSCGDGVGCTVDSCNETTDSCDNTPNNAGCDNALYCDGVESCDAISDCQPGSPPNCGDGVGCTTDSCNETTDSCNHVPNNGTCDNGLYCDGVESCDAINDCQPGSPPNCGDGVGCTVDSCNETTDSCDNTPNNAECDNGVYCDGSEICDAVNDCQAGSAPDCGDGVGCTVDTCNETTNSCDHTTSDASCDNGLYCDGAETCDALNDCQAGSAPNCVDGVGCTLDSCNEATDSCDNLPSNGACSDGLFCSGVEICDVSAGCQLGGNPCPGALCNETTGQCVNCLADVDCNNGVFCDGQETCNTSTGNCLAGTAVICDDGVSCTTDSCNESSDSCDNLPSNASCDNGLFCDGAETCSATAGCQAGTAPNCGDAVGCTGDSCNEATDSCDHVPDNGACGDGLFCNGVEICDASAGCLAGTHVDCADAVSCTLDFCDETNDVCAHPTNDASCNDGQYCNGAEVCDAVDDCQPGTPPNCGDGVGCTVDSCNEANDSCDHVGDNAGCSNGLFCDGTEICDVALGCQAGTAPNCADAVSCTVDSCNEATDACDHAPSDAICDNALFCDGTETCSVTNDCQSGAPPNCADAVGCTTDSCNETTDTCDHLPSNTTCGDGLFCNGAETCDVTGDCQSGSDPCPGLLCSETVGTCVDCLIDADCSNGLFCDGNEQCNTATGTCFAGTPPNCGDGVSCTGDSCNETTDSCNHVPNDVSCGNGLFCDGTEICDPVSDCQPGIPPNCVDSLGCTVDSCNEATDSCDNVSNNTLCSDGLFCNGAEICDAVLGCQAGAAPNCDDSVSCTVDSCNETTDWCDNLPDNAACTDGQFCTGVEICDANASCQVGANPCPGVICNEAADQCGTCLTDANCNNGVFCDGVETCDSLTGTCAAGTPPDCGDSVSCTVDSCNETADRCDNLPNDASCSDGLFCNGAEVCDVTADCQAGTPTDCADSVSCTADSCNETTDSCDHAPDGVVCNDGLFCNGVETCDVTLGCQAGIAVFCGDAFICSTDSCDEITDLCANDFATCVCGDLELTGSEECDPPQIAGTFEDCNNLVDDDGDGIVDCSDPDCFPNARLSICDEDCTLDLVCEKFRKDPGVIRYNKKGGPDRLSLHGRFLLETDTDPMVEGFVFEIGNELGAVYRAFLGFGELTGDASGTRYRFKDKTARVLGEASPSGGLYKVSLIRRTIGGEPFMSFRVRAYGNFKAATKVTMTTQLVLGSAVGSLTADWTASKRKWKLPLIDFE